MPNNLPVVTLGNEAIAEYKGFVLAHSIDISYDPEEMKSPAAEVVILHRDLDLFIQTVAQIETPFPELADHQSKHRVMIRNPFVGTLVPNYLDRKYQVSASLAKY